MSSHVGLDRQNNLVLENGTFKLVENGAEFVQRLRCRLLSYKGEWFLNEFSGVPYFQELFKKPVDISKVESILKGVITSTDGVSEITSFALEYEGATRQVKVTFSFKSIYGEYEGVTINV